MGSIFQKPPFNYQSYVGLSNMIDYAVGDVLVTGNQSNAPLQSITIPGNVFVQEGQKVLVTMCGRSQNPTAAQTFIVNVGSLTTINSGKVTNAALLAWFARMELFRRGNDLFVNFSNEFTYAIDTLNTVTISPLGIINRVLGVNFLLPIVISTLVTTTGVGDTFTQHYMWANVQ